MNIEGFIAYCYRSLYIVCVLSPPPRQVTWNHIQLKEQILEESH